MSYGYNQGYQGQGMPPSRPPMPQQSMQGRWTPQMPPPNMAPMNPGYGQQMGPDGYMYEGQGPIGPPKKYPPVPSADDCIVAFEEVDDNYDVNNISSKTPISFRELEKLIPSHGYADAFYLEQKEIGEAKPINSWQIVRRASRDQFVFKSPAFVTGNYSYTTNLGTWETTFEDETKKSKVIKVTSTGKQIKPVKPKDVYDSKFSVQMTCVAYGTTANHEAVDKTNPKVNAHMKAFVIFLRKVVVMAIMLAHRQKLENQLPWWKDVVAVAPDFKDIKKLEKMDYLTQIWPVIERYVNIGSLGDDMDNNADKSNETDSSNNNSSAYQANQQKTVVKVFRPTTDANFDKFSVYATKSVFRTKSKKEAANDPGIPQYPIRALDEKQTLKHIYNPYPAYYLKVDSKKKKPVWLKLDPFQRDNKKNSGPGVVAKLDLLGYIYPSNNQEDVKTTMKLVIQSEDLLMRTSLFEKTEYKDEREAQVDDEWVQNYTRKFEERMEREKQERIQRKKLAEKQRRQAEGQYTEEDDDENSQNETEKDTESKKNAPDEGDKQMEADLEKAMAQEKELPSNLQQSNSSSNPAHQTHYPQGHQPMNAQPPPDVQQKSGQKRKAGKERHPHEPRGDGRGEERAEQLFDIPSAEYE